MAVTSRGGAEELLADLTPSQRRAVETPSDTVCVLAAAGAGKTRVLTRRIAYRVLARSVRASHAVAITFTRKAAGELRERLKGLGVAEEVSAGTFHSFALSQLRRYWADRRTPEPALLKLKGQLVAELAESRPGLDGVSVAELVGELEWAKARLVSPHGYAESAARAGRATAADPEAVAGLYGRYEDEKRRRRLVDFDDILARYAEALSSDARFGAAQRWRWRHLFVDELQDLNPLQYRVLEALAAGNDDLFVVGDPNQAIYGWNGADPGFLASFPERWRRAEVVHLGENHRCSPEIVAVASAVLGRQGTARLSSSRPSGPLPELRSFPSEEAEAAGIASQVLAARARGLSWGDMAVLVRANSQLEVLAEHLGRAGVPCRAALSPDEGPNAWETGACQAGAAGGTGSAGADEQEGGAADQREAATRARRPLDEGQVTLSSFHRSKGLQWRAVWVAGLEAGLVPIAYATSPAALAEERRLLYVALTRAERELYCSWANKRRAGNGAALRREPSPWLPALAAHCGGPHLDRLRLPRVASCQSAQGRKEVHEFLRAARRRLLGPGHTVGPGEGPTPPDPPAQAAVEALRQWRRRLARASGVPAQVLFHDATLAELALRRPASTEELLAVPGLGAVKVARFGDQILEVLSSAS
jgi:DNA helicase-2/ATP-dependent DNA helicase PcrA